MVWVVGMRQKYLHAHQSDISNRAIKIGIQDDDTEEGVATDLLAAGIPKEDIVLGFRHPNVRQYTEFGTGLSGKDEGSVAESAAVRSA
jgi:hypothetical protein